MNNPRDAYLRGVEARLHLLPEVDRLQELEEVAQHLDALIAARRANGETEPKATNAAIAQFGAARDIGSRLYQTGKHKRFAPLIEVGLFFAVFSCLLTMLNFAFWSGLRAAFYALALRGILPEATAHAIISRFIEAHTLFAPFIVAHGMIGAAAFAVLLARYGSVRGIYQEARQSAPIRAAIAWGLWIIVLGNLHPGRILRLAGVSFSHAEIGAAIGADLLTNVFPVLFTGLAAYLVGRRSKARESVADGVGSAAFTGAVIGLLEALFQFVPTPWYDGSATFQANPLSYLVLFPVALCYMALQIFVAYRSVLAGEKARCLPAPAGKTA